MLKNISILVFVVAITGIFSAIPAFAQEESVNSTQVSGVVTGEGAAVHDGALTENDIEWCEDVFPQYEAAGLNWFLENYHYSIEARVCANLYEDQLWEYDGDDRIQKLVERSKYYVELEIQESEEEAESGKILVSVTKNQVVSLSSQDRMVRAHVEIVDYSPVDGDLFMKIVKKSSGMIVSESKINVRQNSGNVWTTEIGYIVDEEKLSISGSPLGDYKIQVGPENGAYEGSATFSVLGAPTHTSTPTPTTTPIPTPTPTPTPSPSTSPFIGRVKVPNTDYALRYDITGGTVLGTEADVETNSLLIKIETTGDGVLNIPLPRELIDAKTAKGDDGVFHVLVDNKKADFNETIRTNSRTLEISFPDGTEEITIYGTQVVPEFGTLASLSQQPQEPKQTPTPVQEPMPTPTSVSIPSTIQVGSSPQPHSESQQAQKNTEAQQNTHTVDLVKSSNDILKSVILFFQHMFNPLQTYQINTEGELFCFLYVPSEQRDNLQNQFKSQSSEQIRSKYPEESEKMIKFLLVKENQERLTMALATGKGQPPEYAEPLASIMIKEFSINPKLENVLYALLVNDLSVVDHAKLMREFGCDQLPISVNEIKK